MKQRIDLPVSVSLGLLLGRLPMGAFFLLAGCAKIRMGINNFVGFASRSSHVPAAVPQSLVNGYLHAVPFLEIIVGAMLILGLFARAGGLIGSLMVISFVVGATGWTAPGLPFTPNLIYLGVLLAVLLAGPGCASVDRLVFGPAKQRTEN